jgi:hypothetical protein
LRSIFLESAASPWLGLMMLLLPRVVYAGAALVAPLIGDDAQHAAIGSDFAARRDHWHQ